MPPLLTLLQEVALLWELYWLYTKQVWEMDIFSDIPGDRNAVLESWGYKSSVEKNNSDSQTY